MTYSKICRPSNPLIIGYTTRDYLILDLDDSTLTKVVSLVKQMMRAYPEIGDALILKSSDHPLSVKWGYASGSPHIQVTRDSYHVVFNNRVGYNKCCKICSDLADLGVLEYTYTLCREFRGDMTLRVSPSELSSGIKPAPTPICGVLNKNCKTYGDGIEKYLRFCRAFYRFGFGKLESKSEPNDHAYSTDNRAKVNSVDTSIDR